MLCFRNGTYPGGRVARRAPPLLILSLLLIASCGRDQRTREFDAQETADTDIQTVFECELPLASCDGECVSLDYDPSHCGACGASCAAEEHCWEGTCEATCTGDDCGQSTCQAPLVQCGTACADPQHDPRNCGECGVECGDLELCSSGECVSSCPEGFIACDGGCIDPTSSREYCGATVACAGEDAGSVCSEAEVCFLGQCLDTLDEFVTVWRVGEPLTNVWGASEDEEDTMHVTLPLVEQGTYAFVVDWGDGSTSEITSWDSPEKVHHYDEPGDYTVRIRGTISGWQFYRGSDIEQDAQDFSPLVPSWADGAWRLLDVRAWGPLSLGDTEGQFMGTPRMTVSATDAPDLSETTSLRAAFSNGFRNVWNVDDDAFDAQTISLAAWDTSTVTDMSYLFCNAGYLFDADIDGWDTSQVTDMNHLFCGVNNYEGNIGSWDTSQVTDMSSAFYLNANGEGWPEIGSWDVSNVRDMSWMFYFTHPGDLSEWDTSQVTDMGAMFYHSRFNGDISGWDTSSVTTMGSMFRESDFNQPIGDWDTSQVTRMASMFHLARDFDQDIGGWDTSNVTDMNSMFFWATSFNRDIGGWQVQNVTNLELAFSSSGLSTQNYDLLLVGWEAQDVRDGVRMTGGPAYDAGAPAEARQRLIDDHGWDIEDDGVAP